MSLAVLGQQFSRNIEVSVFANTGENIENFAAVGLGVLNAIRGQERQSIIIRKIDKFVVNAFLSAQKMPLKFHKHILATESVDQKSRAIRDVLGNARVSRVGDCVLAIANFSERLF